MIDDPLDILVILDRSGSMQDGRDDHEGGLRSFVADQKKLAGDVRFTLVQFDTQNPCEVIFDRTPIDEVEEGKINLVPRGGTPLLQAIGQAVSLLAGKAVQVICMIITDGGENESRGEWTKDRIRGLIKDQEARGWTFLFLGADIDAFGEARGLGINLGQTMPLNKSMPQSQFAGYHVTSNNILRSRQMMHNQKVDLATAVKSGTMTYSSEDYANVATGTVTGASDGTARLGSTQQASTPDAEGKGE